MADWSGIPGDLLEAISKLLGAIEDLVALRGVCKSWRSDVPKERWRPSVPRLPWLMLADNIEKGTTGFYSLERRERLCDLKLPPARRRWGSQNGWIFNIGPHLETFLMNPLTGVEISLPSLTTIEEQPPEPCSEKAWWDICYVRKAIVFERPKGTAHNCGTEEAGVVAMVIYGRGGRLAVAKPGCKSWAFVENEEFKGIYNTTCLFSLWDVICYKGQVLAVAWHGAVFACNIDNPHRPEAVTFAPQPHFVPNEGEDIYLVESGSDLLMVLRFRKEDDKFGFITTGFEVYNFNFKTKEWKEVEGDLGDVTIFVGRNYSMSVPPKAANLDCKCNSIYFDDSHWMLWDELEGEGGGGGDMGIFDFKEKTFEPHYIGTDSRSFFSPPTWVVPSFFC